ncbi:MAG: YihY/virulence factor BrkB family protein [Anaerolinea sp.]|nr:YihY/virulence factor BrkB family protein [Anaerolinea sp.]
MLRERLTRWGQRAEGWWLNRPAMTRALPSYLARAISNFFSYGARQAAALSYYAIFSIFPLTLLFAVILSRVITPVFEPVIAAQQIEFGLEPFLPPAATQTLQLFQDNLTQALEQGASFSLIAFLGLIWSGLGLFSNITSSLDFIFHVPSSRSIWRQRLIAVAMAGGLIILLVTSFVTSAVLRLVSALLLERPSIWVNVGSIFLPLGLNMVIFALLFRFVPARRVHWDAVWPAAIFGAVGWELAKWAFGWYLTNVANYQFIYGTLSTAIILLFWAYLIASIFLISAEFCAQINEWLLDRHWQEEAEQFLEGKATPRLPKETQSAGD